MPTRPEPTRLRTPPFETTLQAHQAVAATARHRADRRLQVGTNPRPTHQAHSTRTPQLRRPTHQAHSTRTPQLRAEATMTTQVSPTRAGTTSQQAAGTSPVPTPPGGIPPSTHHPASTFSRRSHGAFLASTPRPDQVALPSPTPPRTTLTSTHQAPGGTRPVQLPIRTPTRSTPRPRAPRESRGAIAAHVATSTSERGRKDEERCGTQRLEKDRMGNGGVQASSNPLVLIF